MQQHQQQILQQQTQVKLNNIGQPQAQQQQQQQQQPTVVSTSIQQQQQQQQTQQVTAVPAPRVNIIQQLSQSIEACNNSTQHYKNNARNLLESVQTALHGPPLK